MLSGDIRFNGARTAWGDFAYFPKGGGNGNYGEFRLSKAGSTIVTTPNAKLGVGSLYSAGSVGIGTTAPQDALTVVGYGSFSKGIKVPASPANTACAGTVTLKKGGANVVTSCASTSALVFVTAQNRGGTSGAIQVTGKATGRFDVNSTSPVDASTVAWFIVNGAA